MRQIAVSVDIETDGPVMGLHSMRSIGAVAYDDKAEVGRFTRNIVQHGMTDSSTMVFWRKHPEAWEALQEGDVYEPDEAMTDWNCWLRELGKPVRFVAWPCWFDYGWVRQYSLKYTRNDLFERRYFELGQAFTMNGLRAPRIANETPHVALADAIEQGEQYLWLLNWWDKNGGRPWAKQ